MDPKLIFKKLSSKQGVALVFVMVFLMVVFLSFFSIGRLSSSFIEFEDKSLESTQALYLAETAAALAKVELNSNWDSMTLPYTSSDYSYDQGEAKFEVYSTSESEKRKVVVTGAVPDFDDPDSIRAIELFVEKSGGSLPANFFDYAIRATSSATFASYTRIKDDVYIADAAVSSSHYWGVGCYNGYGFSDPDCFSWTGQPPYASDFTITYPLGGGSYRIHSGYETISSTITTSDSISFGTLDLDALKTIAQGQTFGGHDNYYTAAELATQSLPNSFYYEAPSGGDPGTPHVVYVDGDMNLTYTAMSQVTVGGFVVVAGNADLDYVSFDGLVYTTGDFDLLEEYDSGTGNCEYYGVIADSIFINCPGYGIVEQNSAYIDAIENLSIFSGDLTTISWSEVTPE